MMNFIEKTNLPKGKVTTLICGTDDESILSYFACKGITVIKNAANLGIDSSVSTHADMAAIHLGSDRIVIDKDQAALSAELRSHGMEVLGSENSVTGEYPYDIGLNFAFVGNRILGKFCYADCAFLKEAEGFERLEVKQGYCKCSTLVVSENAIITDDEGIYRKASENGIESLLIAKGDISLEGHPYGFIGGASGKISKNTVLFFGDIKKHRYYKIISEFLSAHGCCFECTDEGALRDIGGIIPIIEEI